MRNVIGTTFRLWASTPVCADKTVADGLHLFAAGTTMRLRVCNELVGSVQSSDGVDTAYGILQLPTTVSNISLHLICPGLTDRAIQL